MLRILKTIAFVCVLSIALNYSTKNVAQTEDVNPPPPLPFTALTLTLGVSKASFLHLEPLQISLKLTNDNNRPALGYNRIGFVATPLRLFITRVGTKEAKSIPRLNPVQAYIAYTNSIMLPHQVTETKDVLAVDLSTNFPGVGDYDIRMHMYDQDRKVSIESNLVTVSIREPSATNRAAYNLIMNSGMQDYLFSGAGFSQTKDTLAALASLPMGNPYARFATFSLGKNLFNNKRYAEAFPYMARLENFDDFAHSDAVRKYLIEIRQKLTAQTATPNPEPRKP